MSRDIIKQHVNEVALQLPSTNVRPTIDVVEGVPDLYRGRTEPNKPDNIIDAEFKLKYDDDYDYCAYGGGKDKELNLPNMSMGGHIVRSGSLGNNSGAISLQTPYVIINRPKLSLPENYAHYHGYPSNITRRIGSLTGFTKVSDVHVDGINCSAMEQGFISQNLKRGFIIGTHRHEDPTVFTLYDNRSDLDTMFKDLNAIITLNDVKMKEPTQLLNPNFIISGVNSDAIIQCNYIYCPQFKRYYVVKDKTSVHTDVWELHCEIDVLETFRNQIADLEAVIERQEFVYNLYLDDGTMKAYSDPYVQTKIFPISFNDKGTEYILIAIGQ